METPTHTAHKNSLMAKLFAIVFLIGVCVVASFSVLGLVIDRSNRARDAIAEVASKWSREQTLNGPVLTIPVQKTITTNTGPQIIESYIFLLPNSLQYDIALQTETRSRGIFDTVVYTSRVKGAGVFNLDEIDISRVEGIIQWNNAKVSVGIPDTRGIESGAELVWNNQKIAFEPGVPAGIIGLAGVNAPLSVQQIKNENSFSFELTLRGSEGIHAVPLGKTTNVAVSSNWPSPHFTGEFLPKEYEITDTGFTAHWDVSSFGRSLPQFWVHTIAAPNPTIEENVKKSAFGVMLHQEVDFYTQVNRAIKYSILFIALTFLAFFMFEVISQLRIHPLNYLLVGLAIALFYLLLLSLSEHIGFLSAYIVSTLSITGLITAYTRSVLKAKKRASIIAALLLVLYSYLYVLLQMDELSLIFGSVFLFGILAIVMYITRNIDWYALSE